MRTRSALWEAVGAVGVMASLLLVAYEVRQNTKAMEGQTLQGISEQATELSFIGVNNPELRSAHAKASDGAFEDLTPGERSVLSWYYAGVMRVTENRYRQYQLGILSQESLRQLGGQAPVFQNPYFKRWWPNHRGQFTEDFAQYVEATLLPLGRSDNS